MGKTTEKITDKMKEQLIALYNEGMMDTEIAGILKVSAGAVLYWRRKLGLKTKFNYKLVSKIDNNKFEELFKKGLSDYKIAEELNMSPDGIYSHRKRFGYLREDIRDNKGIPLNNYQKQVLVGTMLGDSSITLAKDCKNPRFTCAHSLKQLELVELKANIFKNLGSSIYFYKMPKPDKRTGKVYSNYTMSVKANPELLVWYNMFYKNGKKVIPEECFKYFTAVSLAFLYMDDGCKCNNNSYSIATMCFTESDIMKFRKMLFIKLGIETTMRKNKTIYVKNISVKQFTDLIKPYICNKLKYKLLSL